ncbi:M2 family metallopeptidase [bacterium]|nr:M2 family metallopeptidase [bacterium]
MTGVTVADTKTKTFEVQAREVLERHAKEIQPLEKTLSLAWWNANTTGSKEDFKKKADAQDKYDAKISDPKYFAEVKAVREKAGAATDKLLARQIDVLYFQMLEKQVPTDLLKQVSDLSNKIEETFNNYRAHVDGKELTDSAVKGVLKSSLDSKHRQAVWEASKGVGAAVEKDLTQLVKLRNQIAKKQGYANYAELMLAMSEQKPEAVLKLFDELDTLTREPYQKLKAEIDAVLASNYHLTPAQLRPWHYHDPFFQEAPLVYEADLDQVYKKADILALNKKFYDGIGLPIDDVIKRSDLYEKKGKSPHAFCTDIDRKGDVRVLANIVPNEAWMNTMLHELGHSVYSSKNIPDSMPYLLRTESHILTTEGVAMLFQKFSKRADFLQALGLKVDNAAAFNSAGEKLQRAELLVFSRWAQVMFRFEKAMYENPDQDLRALWYSLVEKYQGLKKPEGRNAADYGAKIHIVVAPVYYHNYLMGQLFASQVAHTIAKTVLGGVEPKKASYIGNKKVGDYFKAKVFGPGKSLSWNELTKFATGEELSPKAFAADFN